MSSQAQWPLQRLSQRNRLVCKDECHLFEEASWVLADLGEAWDDVVEVEIADSGMVSTLSFHLSQEKVPAVDWRQDILLFPAEKSKEKTDLLSFIIQENRIIRYKKLLKKCILQITFAIVAI